MNTHEFEKKMMLNAAEYTLLRELFFRETDAEPSDQVNYYYDTSCKELNQRGVTCRIRQKNGRLKGTIKTHLKDRADQSIEHSFAVDELPYRFTVDGCAVHLQGSLYTRRLEITLMPGVIMVLDHNWYLGVCDFELEIEYAPECAAQAEGVYRTILHLLQHTEEKECLSKSQRYFIRKSRLPDATVNKNK